MRPDIDLYFMRMARLVATRSTCLRRAVGCILVDARNHVIATGYNGVARGSPHCNYEEELPNAAEFHPFACAGAKSPSGTNLEACAAVHAEQNAILQCRDNYAIAKAYVTVAPCDSCLKLLINTSCDELVVGGWYFSADGKSNQEAVLNRWAPRRVVFDNRE